MKAFALVISEITEAELETAARDLAFWRNAKDTTLTDLGHYRLVVEVRQ